MNRLVSSVVAGSASRLVIVDLVTLISLFVTVAIADTPPGPTAAETPAGSFVASATLPGPGPLPAFVPPALLKAHHGAATLDDAIDQCVTESMATAGTPGAAVAVALDGALIVERGYGVTRRNGGRPVDADTFFRIGSITKQLTAAAVLQQVELGTVALDNPVTEYVPELELAGQWPADRITVRHLLTHSSAYPDQIFEPAGATGDDALGEWAAQQSEVALHAPPGNFFNYSNPNFNLAGLVVERASGLPYRRYMAEQVLAPAGMTRTTFDPAAVIADGNYSYGHFASPGGLETVYAPDDYDNAVYAPAGYAFSTAGDLVRWALGLLDGGGPVLTPPSAELMQSPQIDLELIPGYSYGYGVFIEPFGELTLRQHGGNIWGWGAYLVWEAEHRFAVAVLANTFESLPAAAYCIADYALAQGSAPPPPDPSDPAAWSRFEGVWDFTTRTSYPLEGEITVEDDDELSLFLWDVHSGWTAAFTLEHAGYGIFLADLDEDGTLDSDFEFLARGSPERVRWLRNRGLVGVRRSTPRPAGGALTP
jgi:CubicO group peptidase (beta-lactamase class C family)